MVTINIIENACSQSVLFWYKHKFARITHSAALLRKMTTLYVLANYIQNLLRSQMVRQLFVIASTIN